MEELDSSIITKPFNLKVDHSKYQHATNADSQSIRVCYTSTRKPIPGVRLEKGKTYPLIAFYAGGEAHYYENAMVAGARIPQTGEIIEKETEMYGAGIYTMRPKF